MGIKLKVIEDEDSLEIYNPSSKKGSMSHYTHTIMFDTKETTVLNSFYFDLGCEDDLLIAIKEGIDKISDCKYDVAEWNLFDLSIGELIIESWQRWFWVGAYADKWKEYTQYLPDGGKRWESK